MADFRTVPIKPMVGLFDTLSSPDEVGFGNWHVVKNATTRSTRNRQRGGGWRRLFADDFPYNNQDLHDQLTDRLGYYEEFSAHAMGGGDISGYNYPYFVPPSSIPGFSVFPPAHGPYCPVYVGDFPSGLYGGCPIFYPSVGYPFELVPSVVSLTGARAHWKMDTIAATTPDLFGGLPLTNFGPTVESGLIGNSLGFHIGDWLESSDANFKTGDIRFGFTGWIRRFNTGLGTELVLGRWAGVGNREYRLYLTGGQLRFEASSNGTLTTGVTNSFVLGLNDWTLFSCWHDQVANTINLKINDGVAASVVYAAGVYALAVATFEIGFDESISSATLDAGIDSLTFWKNGFPTSAELDAIYNASLGVGYPFASEVCNTGAPFYYQYSFLYTSCPTTYDAVPIPGYPYGPQSPVYSSSFSYDYTYCGDQLYSLTGCREAVTMLQEVVTSNGRKLIASTMSRIYELNQSAGNWRILADGLGNSGYTANQCGCNKVRGVSATLGSFLLYTNNFDPPLIYLLGDSFSGCALQIAQPIADMVALGITKAGGVVTWKGFTIFYDFTEDAVRNGGSVLWSDLEDPNSYIESDTSFAGRATIAVGETILAAAPLGNWLIIYTDKSIIRVTLVGGDDVFNFERIYQGGNALKYKFSLINCGDQHLYLGESDVYAFTQFDTRPVNMAWITKAAGMIFKGIAEDDAIYEPINKDACDLVTGGWSDEKREAWLSWPTGQSLCPIVTLRFNLKFNTADFIDHGFTAMMTFRADDRPTVGQWIEDMGICPRGSQVATGIKDGPVCIGDQVAVPNPPLYIRNPEENPDLPVHPDSLCNRLIGLTVEDFCRDCAAESTFITASATDFTLKQQEDDIYYRQMLGGNQEAYSAYACNGEFYHNEPYDTAMQTGTEDFRNDDEKIVKMLGLEAEPLPQSTPSRLEMDVGYGSQPSCMIWKDIRPLDYECQTELTLAQLTARGLRKDGTFYFPCWRRGRFLAARFRIPGIGGGGTFSALQQMVKGWGQQDSP